MAPHVRIEEALAAGLQELFRREGLAGAVVYVANHERRCLQMVADVGLSPGLRTFTAELFLDRSEPGESVSLDAWRTRRFAFRPDAQTFRKTFVPKRLRAPLGAVAAVPILRGGRVTGVLFAAYPQAGALEDQREKLLTHVAKEMSEALQRGKALEDAERRSLGLSALDAVSHLVARGAPLQQVLSASLEHCLRFVGAGRGLILLSDHRARVLRPIASAGFPEWVLKRLTKIDFGTYYTGVVAETGEPLAANDTSADPRVQKTITRFWLRALRIRSFACIPITAEGRVLGTLNLVGDKTDLFLPRVMDSLAAMGAQIGVAVRLANLLEEQRRTGDRLRVERDFSRRLSEGVPAGLLLVSREGQIRTANRWFCRTLRKPRAAIEGQMLESFFRAEGSGAELLSLGLARATAGSPFSCEAVLSPPGSRRRFPVRVRVLPEPAGGGAGTGGAEGKGPYALVIVEDVSPRLEAAEARRRLVEELSAARAVSGWVTSGMGVTASAEAVVRFWRETSGADVAVLWLTEEGGRQALASAVSSRSPRLARSAGKLELTAGQKKQRKPWAVQVSRRASPVRILSRAKDLATVVWAPVPSPEGLMGMVQLGYRESRPVTGAELERYFYLAQSTAVSVRAARQTEELGAQSRRLRELSRAFLAAQERERRRIASELHDEIGNSLTAIQLNLKLIEREAATPGVGERCRELSELTQRTQSEVRRIIHDLRPSLLDDLGLAPALATLVKEFGRRTGLTVKLEVAGLTDRMASEAETALYRVVQEGLTNVARHAGATEASVTVTRDNGMVTATISDNGRRFDSSRMRPNAPPGQGGAEGSGGVLSAALSGGTGLAAMEERLAALGGSVALASNGRGSRLIARLPFRRAP